MLALSDELNSDVEVVMEIRKELKDNRYEEGRDRIRRFMNDGEAEDLDAGIERTKAEAGEPRTVDELLDAMDANEDAAFD